MSVSQNPESDEITAQEAAKRLLAAGDYDAALVALKSTDTDGRTGEVDSLLGLIRFKREEYAAAAEHFAAALSRQPDRRDWQRLHALAVANQTAEVNVHVPPVRHFHRAELLAEPVVPPGALPPAPRRQRIDAVGRLRKALGDASGFAASSVVDGLTEALGRVAGYRDKVWTNWYRRPYLAGIFTLAYMRTQLNKHNLISTYPEGSLVGFQQQGMKPPIGVTHARTPDGSWNNLADPKEGAAGTRFPRNVHAPAIRPERGERLMSPNPREVSLALLTRTDRMKEVPFLNLLAACWINFENHDWISHGETVSTEVYEIPLAEDDPARKLYGQTALVVGKTQPDPTRGPNEPAPITFINEVTHWWDGSQIYGSDAATLSSLRSHVDGKLRISEEGTLPLDERGVEMTGFTRNWWLGLALLHTLFAKEHNAICDELMAAHPRWDDNRLFNVARLVNAAVMAKIHSVEWTPAILPNKMLSDGLNANWYGLLTNLFRSGRSKRTLAEINVRNPELGGVVGNPIDKHGSPFGLTEEFVEVYRLHSLLPESLELRTIQGEDVAEAVPFPQSRQAGSAKITARWPLADLLYSFGVQHAGLLTLNNFPKFMQELSVPGNPVFDLGAVDILRARERGVPRYNEFRRQLGLNPIRRMEDLTDDRDVLAKLRRVYGHDDRAVDRVDLLIGTLAESDKRRPTGFGFGETLFQIFILNATRRLQADRFYTDSYNEETYTQDGLDWIDRATFKSVLLRHYPELRKTGLANVKNAFEPWDSDETLDRSRHPLRWFDRTLQPDPWRGDASRD